MEVKVSRLSKGVTKRKWRRERYLPSRHLGVQGKVMFGTMYRFPYTFYPIELTESDGNFALFKKA
jgi:hypothetical protein